MVMIEVKYYVGPIGLSENAIFHFHILSNDR